jgi:hypothetical protein
VEEECEGTKQKEASRLCHSEAEPVAEEIADSQEKDNDTIRETVKTHLKKIIIKKWED